ncbi:MAG: site-specific DNA-methyltransferase [Chloroflexi bacterium]|nr:site-specific DNA-methyltransferase [Chloroflexota bacterium]
MRSPKLQSRRRSWYPYYAGFSEGFVEDALKTLALTEGAVILDPWNGSGTTTSVAHSTGYRTIGYDTNPALVLVAKGRLLGEDTTPSIASVAKEILHRAASRRSSPLGDEPYTRWFDTTSARRLRSIEWAIQHILIDHESYAPMSSRISLAGVSSLAAFFYVCLFSVVRELTEPLRASNPTWIPDHSSAPLTASWTFLKQAFECATARLTPGRAEHDQGSTIDIASSRRLPLGVGTVDAVITSPPYLTRIDYVVSTLPELATLGFSATQIRSLRDAMLGTPTITTDATLSVAESSGAAANLLERVASHPSKASSTYYLRYYGQYVTGMHDSFVELGRVASASAPLVIVVQDSYYKDVHVDLASVVSEFAAQNGWGLMGHYKFDSRTFAAINRGSRAYKRTFRATESVLVFERSLAHQVNSKPQIGNPLPY